MRRSLFQILTCFLVISLFSSVQSCREDKPFEVIVIDTQEELENLLLSNQSDRYEGDLILSGNITSLQALSSLKKLFGKLAIIDTQITSLNGLENLILVTDDITITSTGPIQQNITNFCAIQGLLEGGSFKSLTITNNLFNPSVQEIIDGDCSL